MDDAIQPPANVGSPELEPVKVDNPERPEQKSISRTWFGAERKFDQDFLEPFRRDGMILMHETRRPEAVLSQGFLSPKARQNAEAGKEPLEYTRGEERVASAAVHFSMNRVYNFDTNPEVDKDPRMYFDHLKYAYEKSGKLCGFLAHPGVMLAKHDVSTLVRKGWSDEPITTAEDITVRGASEDPKDSGHEISLDEIVFIAPRNVLVYGNGELVRDQRLSDIYTEDFEPKTADDLAKKQVELIRSVGDRSGQYHEAKRLAVDDSVVEEDPESVIMRSEDYWMRFFRQMEAKGLKPPSHVFFYDGFSRKGAMAQFREINGIPEPDPTKFVQGLDELDPEIVEHKDENHSGVSHGRGQGKFFRARKS